MVAIAKDVLEGLAQLHALHILHLDLKPGNILLDDYNHAYLSDFGISHALRTLEACTAVTSSTGTPHYTCVHSLLILNLYLQQLCRKHDAVLYVHMHMQCSAILPPQLVYQRF